MPGSVQTTEPAKFVGALKASELTAPLSFKTNLFALIPSPRMLTSPLTTCAPEVITPEVVIVVDPSITALLKVPPLMAGVVSVLLLKVSVAFWVTITPEVGNVAALLIPVPPDALGRMLVIAADCAKSIGAK